MVYVTPTITSTTQITTKLMNLFESQYLEMKTIYDNSNHDSLYYLQSEIQTKFFLKEANRVSSADADKLDGSHAATIIGKGLPIGSIIWWHDDLESIPPGWHLCDGTNGTYDYRDYMILGKGPIHNTLMQTFGALTASVSGNITIATHAITVDEFPIHEHIYYDLNTPWIPSVVTNDALVSSASIQEATSDNGGNQPHGHTGSTITLEDIGIMPEYQSLHLIKRVS